MPEAIEIPASALALIERLDGLNHDLIGLLGGGALGLLELATMGQAISASEVARMRARARELASVWHRLHECRTQFIAAQHGLQPSIPELMQELHEKEAEAMTERALDPALRAICEELRSMAVCIDNDGTPSQIVTADDLRAMASRLDALPAREAEPVAWVVLLNYGDGRWSGEMLTDHLPSKDPNEYKIVRPLYASPPPAQVKVRELSPRDIIAEAINNARYVPDGLPYVDLPHSDQHDNAYAYRLADAVLAALAPASPLVTDERVERAAEGMWRSELDDFSPSASRERHKALWAEENPHVRDKWRRHARAALQAALNPEPQDQR